MSARRLTACIDGLDSPWPQLPLFPLPLPSSAPPCPAAMKLESTKSKHPQLIYEAKLYRILQGAVGELSLSQRSFLAAQKRLGRQAAQPRPSPPLKVRLSLSRTRHAPQAFLTSAGTAWR